MRKSVHTTPASRIDSMVCPLCESDGVRYDKQSVARCSGCSRTLDGAVLETLKQIVALPDTSAAVLASAATRRCDVFLTAR